MGSLHVATGLADRLSLEAKAVAIEVRADVLEAHAAALVIQAELARLGDRRRPAHKVVRRLH